MTFQNDGKRVYIERPWSSADPRRLWRSLLPAGLPSSRQAAPVVKGVSLISPIACDDQRRGGQWRASFSSSLPIALGNSGVHLRECAQTTEEEQE